MKSPNEHSSGFWRELLRADGWSMLVIAFATAGVVLGTYFLSVSRGLPVRNSVLLSIGVMTIWVALAGPASAWWGRGNFSTLLRCGTVADVCGLSMLVIMFAAVGKTGKPCIGFGEVVKIYCILVSMVIFFVGVASCFRSVWGRAASSVLAGFVMLIALASPIWAGGWFVGEYSRDQTTAEWIIRINPFYTASGTLSQKAGFVWDQESMMYGITRMGEYVSPPVVAWYSTVFIYGGIGAVLMLVGMLLFLRRRHTTESRTTES